MAANTQTEFNATEFALLTGTTAPAVKGWIDKGMPAENKASRGYRIKSPAAIKWLRTHNLPKNDPDSTREAGETALEAERRRKLELENDAREGQLVEVEAVVEWAQELAAILASQLDGAAGKMSRGDNELRDRLLNEHRRIRAGIADAFAALFGNVAHGGDTEAAAESVAVAVGGTGENAT